MSFGQAKTYGFNNQPLARLIVANSIINKNGIFLFTGPPAVGNLVLAFAPSAGGVVAGNTYPVGFNFGVWDNTGVLRQHFGIDDNGKLYLADSTGLTRIFSDPALAAQLIYDVSGIALNHLLTSVASASGTDGVGNPFQAGVSVYQYQASVLKIIAQLFNGGLQVGTPAQFAGTGGAVTGTVTGIILQPNTLLVESPIASSSDTAASLELQSTHDSTAGLPVALFSEPAGLVSQGSNPSQVANEALIFANSNGYAKGISGLVGDANVYNLKYLMLSATATPQTISSTSATTITGCSAAIAAARYGFRARVVFKGASALGTANFSVTGPSVTSQFINATFTIGNVAGVGTQNAALGPVDSPTLATTDGIADIEGEGTFTVNGTIALACAMSSGGANVIIDRAHFWLYPLS